MPRELTKTEKVVLGFFGGLAAFFGIKALVRAEEEPPPPPPPPPGMAILYGWLHNVRNEPIINTATHVDGYSGETDQAGRFYISLDPGTYYTLTADGHEPYTFLNPVVLEADTEVCVKYIFLKPIGFEEGKIYGSVSDSNTGQAIAGAHVEAYGQPRGIAGQWAGEAMTNSLGYYEIDWAAGMPSDFLGLEYCHLHVHHPQYHDLETERFDLVRGESIEINLDLVYKGGLPAAPYIYSMRYSIGSGWRELWNVIEGQKEVPAVGLGTASYISVWFYCKAPLWCPVRSTITRPDGTQKVSRTSYYPPGGVPETGEWDYRADGSGGISPLDQLGTYTAKYELLGGLIQGEWEVLYTVYLNLISVI